MPVNERRNMKNLDNWKPSSSSSLLALLLLVLMAQPHLGSCSKVQVELMDILPKSKMNNELLKDLINKLPAEVDMKVINNRNTIAADNATIAAAAASGVAIVTALTPQNLEAASKAGILATPPIAGLRLCAAWRTAQPLAPRDGLYFVNVFHSSVWSILLLSLLLCCAAVLLLEAGHPIGMRHQAPGRQRRSTGALKPFEAFTFTVAGMLQVGQATSPQSASARVLAFFWWLFAFVMCTSYVACTVIEIMATASSSSSSSSWQQQLKASLPLRVNAMYGPLLVLGIGFAAAAITALCEFAYYRFFADESDDYDRDDKLSSDEDHEALNRSEVSMADTTNTYL